MPGAHVVMPCGIASATYHAGMCGAGGERTQRHHAVRDLVYDWWGPAPRMGATPPARADYSRGRK